MRNERGFTLLEMLLAMVLLSLIMVLAYSGFRGALRATRSGEVVMERNSDLRAAYQFVHRQMERILPMAYGSTREGIIVFEGNSERIRYVSPMPGYLGSGGPYVQELSLEQDGEDYSLVFRFAILQNYQEGNLENDDEVTLISDIEAGEFRFMGFDEQGRLSDWQSEWETPSIAPTAVNIQITMTEKARVNWPEMKAAVMVDSSVGGLLQNQNIMQAQPSIVSPREVR